MGESGRICAALHQGRCTGLRPTPKNLGILNNSCDNPKWGEACLAPLPLYHDACIRCMQAKQSRSKRLLGEEPDRPKRTKKEEPQNRKKQRKGLGANPGHKESHISHRPSTNAFRNIFSAHFGNDRRFSLAAAPSRGKL